jgi:RimJ/RimL family protein N-acetyltransferase
MTGTTLSPQALAAARAGVRGRSMRLRVARPEDAQLIFDLRKDEHRARHLSAIGDDVESQREWLRGYVEREERGEELYYVIEHAGIGVGTARLYDFRGDTLMWGSWLIRPGTAPSVGLESALCVYQLVFDVLGFDFLESTVRKVNERVVAFHDRIGARIAGEVESGRQFRFVLDRDDHAAIRRRYAKFVPVPAGGE